MSSPMGTQRTQTGGGRWSEMALEEGRPGELRTWRSAMWKDTEDERVLLGSIPEPFQGRRGRQPPPCSGVLPGLSRVLLPWASTGRQRAFLHSYVFTRRPLLHVCCCCLGSDIISLTWTIENTPWWDVWSFVCYPCPPTPVCSSLCWVIFWKCSFDPAIFLDCFQWPFFVDSGIEPTFLKQAYRIFSPPGSFHLSFPFPFSHTKTLLILQGPTKIFSISMERFCWEKSDFLPSTAFA